MLTDKNGNITDNQFNEFMVDPSERDHYKFYKRTHPTGLHEEIKKGTDLKSGLHPKSYIPTLRELAYKNLPPDKKDEYYNAHKERLVPPPPYKGGLKRKITKKRKRSRLLRGKTKTKTKTRRQKKSPPHLELGGGDLKERILPLRYAQGQDDGNTVILSPKGEGSCLTCYPLPNLRGASRQFVPGCWTEPDGSGRIPS